MKHSLIIYGQTSLCFKKKNRKLVVSIRTVQNQVHLKALNFGGIDLLVDVELR